MLSAGTQTTVQDFPGRLGYWAVGVPPSGPMDDRALRLGNRLLGNDEGAAGLEITMSGPLLRFNTDAVVAVTGADIPLTLDGAEQPMNTALLIKAGSTLSLGTIAGAARAPISPCAAACRCPSTWAAKAPSPSASSAATAAARCVPAMCCIFHLCGHTSSGAQLPAELCTALPAVCASSG